MVCLVSCLRRRWQIFAGQHLLERDQTAVWPQRCHISALAQRPLRIFQQGVAILRVAPRGLTRLASTAASLELAGGACRPAQAHKASVNIAATQRFSWKTTMQKMKRL
jgi:hypothetical protein